MNRGKVLAGLGVGRFQLTDALKKVLEPLLIIGFRRLGIQPAFCGVLQ
jgi:hypothetical protein